MPLLTKDQILAAKDLKDEIVPVPEWGGDVRIIGLTRCERDKFEDGLATGKGKNRKVNMANFSAKLLALTIVDEQGKRLFYDADIVALGEKSAGAMQRCLDVTTRLSGFSTEEIEELTKN